MGASHALATNATKSSNSSPTPWALPPPEASMKIARGSRRDDASVAVAYALRPYQGEKVPPFLLPLP